MNCLSRAESLLDGRELINVYDNKADINLFLEKYDESESIYKKVIDIETELKDSSNLILSYTNLANFYYNQYIDDKAIPLFKKALDIAKKVNDLDKLKDAHYNMHVVYKNLGNDNILALLRKILWINLILRPNAFFRFQTNYLCKKNWKNQKQEKNTHEIISEI